MKFKQPATAGKQQAAARNRSRACAYAGARSELFFLSQSLRKSAVVFARSKASKGDDEQSLTGEDGRPDATSGFISSQQVRSTQSDRKSGASEAKNNFNRQP